MCQHSEYRRGYRSYGSNIPGYAQGAYFPGDEPGEYCRLEGCRCMALDEPELCPVKERTGRFCDTCEFDDGIALPVYRNGAGVEYCECGHVDRRTVH